LLIPFVSLLIISNILVFAQEQEQQQQEQQQQNVNIASDNDDSSFFSFFERIKNLTESHNVDDNTMETTTDYNFIAAGDWYCNEETKKTISNIIKENPELIITTGDQVKESPSAACWIEMSAPIIDKMKIAIGNHDAEFKNIYKQIVDYHHLTSPYYSYNFKNIHFISMSTEHPFEEGSNQYEFIKSDLEKIANNPNIDWIVVHQHKPLYSTLQDRGEAEELRDTYQRLFQQYDVDLVMSSHNQYYERTYPLLYNEEYEKDTNKEAEPNPIITNPSRSEYSNKDKGIIFLTVGTAGDELNSIKERPPFYVFQDSQYGFLEFEMKNNGKTLVGQFHTNDGKIIDQFTLNDI
jgi:hypothetical protein